MKTQKQIHSLAINNTKNGMFAVDGFEIGYTMAMNEHVNTELLKAVIMSKDIFTKLMASGRLTMPAEDYEMIKKAIIKATK